MTRRAVPLLALAACLPHLDPPSDGEPAGTDTSAAPGPSGDTAEVAPETTDTAAPFLATDTAPVGYGVGFVPVGFTVDASWGVTSAGAVAAVTLDEGSGPVTLAPLVTLHVHGVGWDPAIEDPATGCTVQYEVAAGAPADPPAGDWYAWSVASAGLVVVFDSCATGDVRVEGEPVADALRRDLTFSVGPVRDAALAGWLAGAGYADRFAGGALDPSLGAPELLATYTWAYAVDAAMNVDTAAPLAVADIPADGGVRAGWYTAIGWYDLPL